MFCDLHTHSTASDGTEPPSGLPALARAAGLGALALTDHDTTGGLAECERACRDVGIDFVPGIELSADPASIEASSAATTAPAGTLHILGLFVKHDDAGLLAIHQRMQAARDDRNHRIICKLNDLGVRIDLDEVVNVVRAQGGDVIGRPHVAQVLIQKGYAKSTQDAFVRYLGQGAPAYVPRTRLQAREAIQAIHRAGGLAILAHPVQLRCDDFDHLEHCVRRLKDQGMDGLETRHPDHTPADVERLEQMAQKLKLLTSGGSDFHGSRHTTALGCARVPIAVYQRLLEYRDRVRGKAP